MCLFSGTPTKWECTKFSYGDYSGSIYVDNDKFTINIQANNQMPSNTEFMNMIYKLGDTGIVNFKFSDIAGTYNSSPNSNVKLTIFYNVIL